MQVRQRKCLTAACTERSAGHVTAVSIRLPGQPGFIREEVFGKRKT